MTSTLADRIISTPSTSFPCIHQEAIYDVFGVQDLDRAIHCLATTFSSGEPITAGLGISKHDFLPFAERFCTKAVREGLSVVAKDRQTGEFLGCVISEDFWGDPPEGLDQLNSCFEPIFTLLDTLDQYYKATHSPIRNTLLHEFMVGVYPAYKGRNIGYRLVEVNNELGRTKLFTGAIAEVTGPISQHIFIDKHQYQVLDRVQYSDFNFQERAIFSGIKTNNSCQLVYKQFSQFESDGE